MSESEMVFVANKPGMSMTKKLFLGAVAIGAAALVYKAATGDTRGDEVIEGFIGAAPKGVAIGAAVGFVSGYGIVDGAITGAFTAGVIGGLRVNAEINPENLAQDYNG